MASPWALANGNPLPEPCRFNETYVRLNDKAPLGRCDHPTDDPLKRVLLAGTRDLDPAEQERLASSPIRQLPADRLAEGPLPTLDGHPVHLHLDLDVLHASLGPVNSYGLTSGGVPRARLLELVEAVSHRAGLRSVAITAYDPGVDSGDVANAALDVLEILGRDEGAPPR